MGWMGKFDPRSVQSHHSLRWAQDIGATCVTGVWGRVENNQGDITYMHENVSMNPLAM